MIQELLILFVVALVLTALLFFMKDIIIGFMAVFFTAVYAFAILILYREEPKAIDVYKGKTSLEITYRNGVPVDSVVVFKTK